MYTHKRMGAQERRWLPAKKEDSRAQYLIRLQRTAMRLPADFINQSISNLNVCCQRQWEAEGGRINEGGAGSS